ncbi:aminodeoxychorismate synthase component I [Microbacterium sp. W1N]|uniref:aminodeoxychorismate synthase component I n=1 Tax=Microbacterium festucae TaxID=2977531 RepID=UPI0021C04D2A|nr:aminodeoxychorismate synthase component I [Microbacterium festucae]MCT9820151.1 aminodeoxychorismate synthase component I [Microbacterium festucae]
MPEPLVARALSAWIDPAERFVSGPGRGPDAFWLDAGPDAVDGWSWLGAGTPVADAPREVACARDEPDRAWGPFGGGWVGWLAYDDAAARAGAPATPDAGTAAAAFVHVDRFLAVDHAARRQWAVAPASAIDAFAAEVEQWRGVSASAPPAPATTARARHTAGAYAHLIARCRDAIREGDAYQLCLTTRFDVDGDIDPLAAYLRLRAASPSHHGGYLRTGGIALASATPERFLEITAGRVRTSPIKGTRPRGADAAADAALARELAASIKEQAENVMIVDLMRNDLQRVCEPGSVIAERLLEVESYPAVHQLVSTVSGRLRDGIRIGDVLDAAFPAGSMTGAPKLSAMSILHALEQGPRGVFSGCFGWIGSDGAADLAMVIRSIVVHPGGAYVGAGGGITWRSDPAEEVAEVALKARRPLAAIGAALPNGW